MRTLILLLAVLTLPAFGESVQQKDFASPDDAAKALIAAVQSGESQSLLAVLGADAHEAIDSGDPVQDKNARERFLKAYQAAHSFDKNKPNAIVLQVGADNWPFPFPIVPSGKRWRFDSAAGKDELVNRRVGANELATIQSCLAFVDAEREYYSRNPQNDSLLHFAQKLISTDGKKDGLYWKTSGNEPPSPLGEEFARARGEGYLKSANPKSEPYHGYMYRLLTAQGPHAKGGAYDYMVRDKMMGGFALLAFPAEYGSSGVMTFMVNHDGVVYSKDLGEKTAEAAMAIKQFDPDSSWKREATDK